MFTLSEKIRVVNSPSSLSVVDASNAPVVTSGAISNTDVLKVEGFGRFDIGNIINIKCRRSVPATTDSKDYTVVAPTGVAVGDAIEVVVSLTTTRYQSEVLTSNSIGGGRTLKFSTAPLTAITPTAIRTAIVAGYAAHQALFEVGQNLVTASNGATATTVKFTADAAGSISIKRVELKRVNQGIGTQNLVSLAVAVVNSVANEGQGLGKFLEESVRMSTSSNNDPYGVDTNDTRIDLRGAYTEISFDYATTFEENLATNGADYGSTSINGPGVGGVPAVHSFVLFFNEGLSNGLNSAIGMLAAIAILRAGVYSYLTSTITPAPLTIAQERSEVLILANLSSVDTVAAFVA